MLTVNKTLGITYTNDDVTNTALETFCMSNCELRQLNITIDHTNDSFMIIAEYVDEVNHASIAANSTADYITYNDLYYHIYGCDSELQRQCILKVWL